MNTTRTCPQCQQALPADAPEGLCPACVMQNLAATQPGDPTHILPPGSTPAPRVDIADPAEIARRLPQFEIIELLGRGGMGVVYKARQPQLDRMVALKILPPEDSHSADFVERFRREARSLAKLNHPNIVTVHDFGESDGLYYFIMEFVDGANLRQLLQAKKLTADQALAIVPKVCDALEYAHEEGVVHRDIKPENILIDKKGRVKIADFGLAKLLRREALDMTLTLAGSTLGTLRYMAPEQMDKPESVDHRADIYSLGVVFYEMLTGDTPVGRFALPSQKAAVDARLDEIVLHAIEREPDRRYQHASEVRTDLQNVTSTPKAIAAAIDTPAVSEKTAINAASEAAEPLPRTFWLRAFGWLMLGWIVVGALWNFRSAGCVLGALVLSGIITELAFRHARSKPRWLREWRAAAAWKRVYIVSGYIAVGVIPFMLLISTLDNVWESGRLRWNWDAQSADEFAAAYKGKEYQLIRGLDAFKEDVPVTELAQTGFSWRGGWNMWGDAGPHHGLFGTASNVAGTIAVLFILLVFFQQIVGQESFSLVRLTTGGWRLALKFLLTVCLSAVCAYATIFTLYLYKQAIGNSDYMARSRVVTASVKQVTMALKKWAVENGQATGDEVRWNFSTVPKGAFVAEAALFSAWEPSPFDRWQMTWAGLHRTSPHVAARIVGTEQPLQARVLFSAKMPMRDAQDKARMESVLQSMEDAINNAAKLDAKKPLEEQITMKAGGSSSNSISGWWLFAGVVGLSIAWAKLRHGSVHPGNPAAAVMKAADPKDACRFETWWLSRSPGKQKLMSIVLGSAVVLSVIAFLTFDVKSTQTADHSGVPRNLRDVTIGLGDPWFYILHHQTGTRGGFKSGVNLVAGSALFGYAALFGILASLRLSREQKRRKVLHGASTDTPQRKFFWSAVAGVVLFIAGVAGVIVHEVRNDNNGGLLADAVHEVHPDFTRPGITSLALKKAIADELQLTPEQLEKVNASLNRAYFEFLKLENEHSLYRSENGHLVKIIKPFPDRSFDLAQRLATELRGIAGKPIIDEPERNAVWKLRLFRHAGEFDVRAELWEKDGKFHRDESWMRAGEKVMGGKSGDTLDDMKLAFGHYIVDWEAQKDIIHEPRPDDAKHSHTLGSDVPVFFIERIRNGELARLMAVKDPDTVVKSGDPHAALVTQAGTGLGRACAETELKLHGIPFAKDAAAEELVRKLEQLLGAPPGS